MLRRGFLACNEPRLFNVVGGVIGQDQTGNRRIGSRDEHDEALFTLVGKTRCELDLRYQPKRIFLSSCSTDSWPELGFEEVKTSTFIEDQLTKIPGVSVVTKLGVTGLIGMLVSCKMIESSFFLNSSDFPYCVFAIGFNGIDVYRYRGTNPGPTVAFRADMDGLPVNERGKDESWISKNTGIAHACGHDGHVTSTFTLGRLGWCCVVALLTTFMPVLLTFARAFCAKYKPSQIHGTIVFVFQPAEESGGGAPKMLADGLLTAGGLSDIDFFYGIHVISSLPVGTVATKPGPLMAGIDGFEINGGSEKPYFRDQNAAALARYQPCLSRFQSKASEDMVPCRTRR